MTRTLVQSEPQPAAPPLVCACVVTYNGKRFLERCFQTLSDLTAYANHRLILVDNGSSDGSGDYVRQNFANVEVTRVSPNIGYAHGANWAIQEARRKNAKYVVLMNDDIEILHSDWLSQAVAHAECDSSIGIIALTQTTPDDSEAPLPTAALIDAEYIGSPVLFFPVELFDRIGWFDEVYFVVGDEDDVAARTQAAGYRTCKLDIPVYHFGGGSHQKCSRRAAYLQMRNGIRFCIKNKTMTHALLRTLRIIDVACNPWPLTIRKSDVSHRRVRNSGNVLVNSWLWLRAVSWNIVRLPQTLRIRTAERRLIHATQQYRERARARPEQAYAEPAGQLTF